jgi:uncharacterized phiE125 gp8 family phage protein
MGLKLITAATGTPVTLDEVKTEIGIESSDWDAKLTLDIAIAASAIEEWTGRAIGAQTWEYTLPAFIDEIDLPYGPVTGITSVTYLDANRITETLGASNYIADLVSDPQRIVRDPDASWPATAKVPNAVIIRFVTGFATTPPLIKKAILATVAHWFVNRETAELPKGVMTLLDSYRSQWICA